MDSKQAPPGWVPVERRWFGLDRATILPALLVLGLALLMQFGVPFLNRLIPYGDTAEPGDVMQLKGGITFVPAPGWQITSGVREGTRPAEDDYPPQAVVHNGGARVAVKTGPFRGDARALLEQIKKTSDALNGRHGLHVTTDPVPVRTSDGIVGVLARYSGTSSDGAVAAYVVDGTGVEVVATAPTDAAAGQTEAIADMLTSVGRK